MTSSILRGASLIAPLFLMACSVPPVSGPGPDPWQASGSGVPAGWTLSWSDEFDGPNGSAVDATKWAHDVGGTGWGNQELEYDTDGTQNASIRDGALVIEADRADPSVVGPCWNGPCEYTSSRINTQGKFSQAYGRFEASIQIASGQGMWPAFWLLGENIAQVGWPACGEVDIMENAGAAPDVVHGSLHAPGNALLSAVYTAPASLADGFHTYAIDWSPAAIWFYVDGELYETQASDEAASGEWPFQQPFFIILDLAVGGIFGGAPDSSTVFPQTMKVDYVRVYSQVSGGA